MINKIIDGISEAIFTTFGDGYEIYTESVEQGLREPCFFIWCLNPAREQFFGSRYLRRNQCMVQFFPSINEKNEEMNQVTEGLFDCLELITVDGDLVRGTKMKSEVSNGVLQFHVCFDLFVCKEESKEESMGSYEIHGIVKEGD